MCKIVFRLFFTVSLIMLTLPAACGAVSITLVSDTLSDTLEVGRGEQFDVDVVLDNAGSEGLVAIGIWIQYDENLLNVVDTDSGNWITEGINILDGLYHIPFDLPGDPGMFDNANDAGIAGEIAWDARRSWSDWTDITPCGIFATITFEAQDVLGQTALEFFGAGMGGYPDTYVMNAAGDQILISTSGASVNVIPEPGTILLLSAGLFSVFGVKRRKIY